MPHPSPVSPLRLGAIAFATWSLVACGGGDVTEPEIAQASDAVEDSAAGRATSLNTSSLPAGPIQLVTTDGSGAPALAGTSPCSVSADGRLVLFYSEASNLVPGDTNRTADLFLKNRDTGAVQRVTTQSNGAQISAGGNCLGASMTPDARLVAFNSERAVFVKNTQTGELRQVSPPLGTLPQVEGFFGGVLSDDGRRVVFLTQPRMGFGPAYTSFNFIPARLMVRDLQTGTLETLATDNGIVAQGEVIGSRFAISPDGTQVAFVSSSSSLVQGDNNGRPDVFVRHLANGSTTLVSSTSAGQGSTAVQYWDPTFVSNHQVAFGTGGLSNLGAQGLYLKDLNSGVLRQVLSSADGGSDAVLSGGARKVAFQRLYSGWNTRVFVRDLATGEEALVSASATGTASNNTSNQATISRDGSTVIFGSSARNLVSPRPPAGVFQVYAKSIGAAAVK